MELPYSVVELQRLIEAATFSAQSQFEEAKTWRMADWVLSALAAATAGVAGIATIAADMPAFAFAMLALAASSLTILHATLRPEGRYVQARDAANAYLSLASSGRVLLERSDELEDQRRDVLFLHLVEEQRRINERAELPFARSFRRGRRNILAGYQTYEIDAAEAVVDPATP